LKTNDYEKIIIECKQILDKNPVSLLANNKMGFALYKLKKTRFGMEEISKQI
jgi:23S rRNA G2069 N7-methylase RlmK/C1962 C5-methylase RlmI